MTQHESHEYSSDEAEFSEILDDLLVMQSKMRASDDIESVPPEHYATIYRLQQLCSGKEISVSSSSLLTPVKDERGIVVSMKLSDGSVTGTFEDLAVDTISSDAVSLGLQIRLETARSSSPVHDSEITTYA